MGRHAEITLKNVEDAANQIREQNLRPTIAKVRGVLQKGSTPVISKYLKVHLKKYEESQETINIDISENIYARFREAVMMATNDKTKLLLEAKKESELKNTQIQDILKELEEESNELERKKIEVKASWSKLDETRENLYDVKKDNEELKAELKNLSKVKEELIFEKSKCQGLQDQVKDLKEIISNFQKPEKKEKAKKSSKVKS